MMKMINRTTKVTQRVPPKSYDYRTNYRRDSVESTDLFALAGAVCSDGNSMGYLRRTDGKAGIRIRGTLVLVIRGQSSTLPGGDSLGGDF